MRKIFQLIASVSIASVMQGCIILEPYMMRHPDHHPPPPGEYHEQKPHPPSDHYHNRADHRPVRRS